MFRFKQTPIVFIKIVGIFNSANEVFHCVHFECPAQVSHDELEMSETVCEEIVQTNANTIDNSLGKFEEAEAAQASSGNLADNLPSSSTSNEKDATEENELGTGT